MRLLTLVLFIILTISTASAQDVTYYLVPGGDDVPDCTSMVVELRINPNGLNVGGGTIGITYNTSCADVTNFAFDPHWHAILSTWNAPGWSQCWDRDGAGMDTDWIIFAQFVEVTSDISIGNFTINCSNPSGNCDYCITDLNFTCSPLGCGTCAIEVTDSMGDPHPFNYTNPAGTFTCGTIPSEETFSKPLYEGWNLISLPLVPGDTSVSAVLSTVSHDAVYRYNATSKKFENADVMDPGTGYFVHATADCTWVYSGTAYTSTNVPMEPGLNMVGWLNCSKNVDVLSSISGDCYYVARWNTTAEKFEVYNPAAPSTFNDFATMDRGTGYFISAKQDCADCALSENC